jgi:hypothetical protein
MTTTARASAPADHAESGAAARFVRELVRMHATLRYAGLPDAVTGPPLCRIEGYGDGLVTIGMREGQLPERYLRAVLGFRLAQFLQTGLMDRELAHRGALFHEPVSRAKGGETYHTITLTDTGRIVGYIGLVGSADPAPLPLDSPMRIGFPVEVAHRVDLLSERAAPDLTTHNVVEIKRFVRDRSMPRGEQRDRVPWHLILGALKVGTAMPELRLVVGDAGERGALRHLRLVGLDMSVVEGTTPWLPRTELMWPSYEVPARRRAKPFVAPIPPGLPGYVDMIESVLASGSGGWQRAAVAGLGGPSSMRA